VFSSIGVVEGCFKGKLLIFKGLDMPGDGLIPIDDPFIFVAKALNFFDMSVPDE
jgi:hypothetical protein